MCGRMSYTAAGAPVEDAAAFWCFERPEVAVFALAVSSVIPLMRPLLESLSPGVLLSEFF